jgi:hypothetical protein
MLRHEYSLLTQSQIVCFAIVLLRYVGLLGFRIEDQKRAQPEVIATTTALLLEDARLSHVKTDCIKS